MRKLFTERHGQTKPRVAEILDDSTRNALLNLVSTRIDQEYFGLSFPSKCVDGYLYGGTDVQNLRMTMDGYDVLWPDDANSLDPPSDGTVFDLIEFAYEFIAEAQYKEFHSYGNDSHYSYDKETGQVRFSDDVNRIFERNGIAFELKDGEVTRIAPAILHESLGEAIFDTGDDALDDLLEAARNRFLNRSVNTRQESLEKLWDAWERLKTLEPGKKKASIKALLDKASTEPTFRELIEKEARELTDIGNDFMIRHTETDTVPVNGSVQVDYFFHRMFSMIRLLLRATGRGL